MRVFSGVRPTGKLHIGNYIGSIKQWLELQEKHDCIFCIVDLHAITTPFSPKALKRDIYLTALAYFTAGIDPKKSIVFVQSMVKEHTELAWILGCITPVGELFRMTQYKEKAKEIEQKREFVGAGLLNYPLLMAADILLYKTQLVPVGEDQQQHVELTREIARRFNKRFGRVFVIPKARIKKETGRIKSLTDPAKKMSKTGDPKGCIFLFDSEKEIVQKIKRAVTDSEREIRYDLQNKPGVSNLLLILAAFSGKKISQLEKRFKGAGYKELKEEVAAVLIKELQPFRKALKSLKFSALEKELKRGGKRAQKIAQETMREVYSKVGLMGQI